MKIKYQIGDYCVEIQSEFLIETSSSFKSFECKKNRDILVVLKPVNQLSSFEGYQDFNSEADRMLSIYKDDTGFILAIRTGLKGEIFAHVRFQEDDKKIIVYYLKGHEHRLKTSKQCFENIGLENILSYFDTFILHSSLISYQNQGILFIGPSGIGKSTRADLWKEYADAKILNGDRVIVRKLLNEWYGYGSPFAGSSNYYINEKVKIKAIINIVRGNDDEIELQKLTISQSIKELYKNTTICLWNKLHLLKILKLLEDVAREIPVYKMICPPDRRVVDLLKEELRL